MCPYLYPPPSAREEPACVFGKADAALVPGSAGLGSTEMLSTYGEGGCS
jgi:hypothetical protein